MKKRGQVTIFIILGLLILITVMSIFFMKEYVKEQELKEMEEKQLKLESKAQSIKLLVENCIKNIGEKAVITIGHRGGKKKLEEPFFDADIFESNYLYYLGDRKNSSIEDIENSLAKIMNERLTECLPADFSRENILNDEILTKSLIFTGVDIETGTINTTVTINDEKVIFAVNWPLILSMNEMEKNIEDFAPASYPVRLKKIIFFVDDFVRKLEINPYFIDAFYLLEQNLTIDMAVFDEDTYVILIKDHESIIASDPFRFLLAVKVKVPEVRI